MVMIMMIVTITIIPFIGWHSRKLWSKVFAYVKAGKKHRYFRYRAVLIFKNSVSNKHNKTLFVFVSGLLCFTFVCILLGLLEYYLNIITLK